MLAVWQRGAMISAHVDEHHAVRCRRRDRRRVVPRASRVPRGRGASVCTSRARGVAKATCCRSTRRCAAIASRSRRSAGPSRWSRPGSVSRDRTRTHRALVRAAEDAGVDAVQILGPRPGPLPMRLDEIETHFRTVIDDGARVRRAPLEQLRCSPVRTSRSPRSSSCSTRTRASPCVNLTDRNLPTMVPPLGADAVEVRIGLTRGARPTVRADGFLSFEANVAPALVADACATRRVRRAARAERGARRAAATRVR